MSAAPPAVVGARVLAVVGLARGLALAQLAAPRAHRVPLLLLARSPLLARALLPGPAARPVVVALAVLVAVPPVVAGLVVVPAVRPLNRQWCSVAMARTTR